MLPTGAGLGEVANVFASGFGTARRRREAPCPFARNVGPLPRPDDSRVGHPDALGEADQIVASAETLAAAGVDDDIRRAWTALQVGLCARDDGRDRIDNRLSDYMHMLTASIAS